MIEKLNAVLDLFSRERPEWVASEVAQALAMPRSTTYRLLARISTAGFLDNDPATGRYRLGIRLAALGTQAQYSTRLQRAARPALQQLAFDSRLTATLMVRSGLGARVVDVVDGVQPSLSLPCLIGCQLPLHASAGGKVMLAAMGEEERRGVYRRGLPRQTPSTLVEAEALEAELRQVREHGVALNRGEWQTDAFGVAAPIRNASRGVIGAVTVGGPRERVTDDTLRALTAQVSAAAAQVTAALADRSADA